MTYKPLRDYVLVERKVGEKVSTGGIFIPATVEDARVVNGVVKDVGPGWALADGKHQKIKVKVNEVVAFFKDAAIKLEDDLYLVQETDLLCKVL